MCQHNQNTIILAERTAFEFSRFTIQYVAETVWRRSVSRQKFKQGKLKEIRRGAERSTENTEGTMRTANWKRRQPDDDDYDDDDDNNNNNNNNNNPYVYILENYLDFIQVMYFIPHILTLYK